MKNKKSFFTPPFLIQGDRKEPKTFILLIYPRISAKSASGVVIGAMAVIFYPDNLKYSVR